MKTLPRSLQIYLTVLPIVTACCLFLEAFWRHIQHRRDPYRWPLVAQGHAFSDLLVFKARFQHFHSPAFFTDPLWPYTYPAPVTFLYAFFYLFPREIWAFVAVFALIVTFATIFAKRTLLRAGLGRAQVTTLLGITLVFGYPLFFELEQGNMELIIAFLTGLALLNFLRGNGYTSATLIGIAGGMKLFPFILIGLFIARRQMRYAAWALGIGAVLNVVGLWAVCPQLGASVRGISSGLASFRSDYILKYFGFGFDHSFFTLPKLVLLVTHGTLFGRPEPSSDTVAHALRLYLVAAGLTAAALYWFIVRKRPVLNQIIFLVVCSIALPPVSFDYTLIHLFAPWLCLVLATVWASTGQSSGPATAVIFTLFALAIAPESELIFRGQPLGGQFKAVVLLAIVVWSLACPTPSRFDRIPVVC